MVNKDFYNVCWNKSNTIKLLAAHTAYVKVGWKPVNLSSFSNFHAIQSTACLWGPRGNEEHLPRKQVLRSGGYRFLHFHKKKKKDESFSMETKGTGSDVLQPHRRKGDCPCSRAACRQQLRAAHRLQKLVLPRSQTVGPILIRESFQMFASCIKYSYNLLDSLVYILSEAKTDVQRILTFDKGKGPPSSLPTLPTRGCLPASPPPPRPARGCLSALPPARGH